MNDNILIAYYMHKGHSTSTSRRIADDIATGLLEKEYSSVEFAITPVEEFPTHNRLFEEQVKMEKKNHFRPTLTGRVGKFDTYDTIILVAPNWYGDVPMGVYSFLDEYDFAGKRVFPVICHGGDGGAEIREAIRKYLPKADVADGVDIPDSVEDDKEVKEAVKLILDKK